MYLSPRATPQLSERFQAEEKVSPVTSSSSQATSLQTAYANTQTASSPFSLPLSNTPNRTSEHEANLYSSMEKNVLLVIDFIRQRWRLIYSLYKGHPESMANIVNKFYVKEKHEIYSCFFVHHLWVDLFCERETERSIRKDSVLYPGHLYVFDVLDHVFTLVYFDEDLVLYVDYYFEARGEDGFRIEIMDEARMQSVYEDMQRGNIRAIVKFHGAKSAARLGLFAAAYDDKTRELLFPNYIRRIEVYEISKIPTFESLLDVCFNKGSFKDEVDTPLSHLEDVAYGLLEKEKGRGSVTQEALKGKTVQLLKEYYLQWCESFSSLVRELM